MKFRLQRVWVGDQGAFGVLMRNDEPPFAVTLERTFRPNNEIVIPFGTHKCIKGRFNRGGYDSYEIMVSGHSHVKFHKGNKEAHSEGCILVAEYFHDFDDIEGIANSAGGFKEFMHKANNANEFLLEVI